VHITKKKKKPHHPHIIGWAIPNKKKGKKRKDLRKKPKKVKKRKKRERLIT